MKLAIVGSRNFKYQNFVKIKISEVCEVLGKVHNPLFIISGGAKGVDSWAEEEAKNWEDLGVKIKIFKPDWDKYGKRAGFLRNELIVNEATHLWAFWDGESKGTKHSIDLAIKKRIPVNIYIRK